MSTRDPVFVISLQKGLADRNRLPVSYVIKVLQEVRAMIIDVGRELLKERGVDEPTTADFGLELVADESGIAFHKGSLRATVAITRDVEVGVLAAQTVLNTVHGLSARRTPISSTMRQLDPTESIIVHRLDRIAFINQVAKAEAKFQVKAPKPLLAVDTDKIKFRKTATFGAMGVEAIRPYRLPVFEEENLMLYGRLFELNDPGADALSGSFWGELRRDSGDVWRLQFRDEDQDLVTPLFRRQVMVTGTAHYYQTKSPKLVIYAGSVSADMDRDYETAFDELFGCEKTSFSPPLEELLKMRYS